MEKGWEKKGLRNFLCPIPRRLARIACALLAVRHQGLDSGLILRDRSRCGATTRAT